jgi:hypothetical protein
MKSLSKYYLSRTVIAIIFGLLFVFLGAPWWLGVFTGMLVLIGFVLALQSGRYVKQIQADGQIRLVHSGCV